MSEQTPDTNSGVSDSQDPSMEDILASIRKIIAEDDVQSEVAPAATLNVIETAPLTGDVSDLAEDDYLDLDILDTDLTSTEVEPVAETEFVSNVTDIDDLIGGMDAQVSDDIAVLQPEADSVTEEGSDDILDLMIPMDEPEVTIDESADLATDDVLKADTSLVLEIICSRMPYLSKILRRL